MNDIDSRQLSVVHNEFQGSLETLVFFTFPMKIDADDHIRQFKRIGVGRQRSKQQFVVAFSVPFYLSVGKGRLLLAAYRLAFLLIWSAERKFDGRGRQSISVDGRQTSSNICWMWAAVIL